MSPQADAPRLHLVSFDGRKPPPARRKPNRKSYIVGFVDGPRRAKPAPREVAKGDRFLSPSNPKEEQ